MTSTNQRPRRVGRLSSIRHNLPARRVRLVGREDDSVAVRQLALEAAGRLATLTGTGGCGKTQLALQVAADMLDRFPDGVWFVDLAALQVPELVPNAVAAVLGRHEHPGRALVDTIVAYLRTRQLLLVLDNCEHLIEVTAELAERILATCPEVRLLATSRERLRVPGEVTWRVTSLRSPDPQATVAPADLLDYSAAQLFVDRATAAQPDFTLTSGNVADVARICARLEGLPLAVELAAARVPVLSPAQVLERLDDSFHLLVGGSRTAPGRQQTMRATLDWSYRLLTQRERLVFARLAVFAADFSLEAAEAVCPEGDVASSEVLDLLGALVEKSLLVGEERDGVTRYRLLEPVRQYAQECLIASGEYDRMRRRHGLCYVAYGEARNFETNRGGPRRFEATMELDREYPNIRAALSWAIEAGETEPGLSLAGSLLFLWQIQGAISEGRDWLVRLFALPSADAPTVGRARSLAALGHMEQMRPDYEASLAACDEAIRLAQQLNEPLIEWLGLLFSANSAVTHGDVRRAENYGRRALTCARAAADGVCEGMSLMAVSVIAWVRVDLAEAEQLIAQALRLARAERDSWNELFALIVSGHLRLAQRDFSGAHQFLEAALVIARRCGDPPGGTAWTLDGLGEVATASARFDQARAWLIKRLELRYESGGIDILPTTLDRLAVVEAASGQPERALRLTGAADAIYEALGQPRIETDRQLQVERWLSAARDRLGAERADRLFAEGRALSIEDAVALACAGAEAAAAVAESRSQPLTQREQDVATLLADGLTNRQIADRLVITERIVAAHIEHILNKLGFASRHQVAIWAVEHDLSG